MGPVHQVHQVGAVGMPPAHTHTHIVLAPHRELEAERVVIWVDGHVTATRIVLVEDMVPPVPVDGAVGVVQPAFRREEVIARPVSILAHPVAQFLCVGDQLLRVGDLAAALIPVVHRCRISSRAVTRSRS